MIKRAIQKGIIEKLQNPGKIIIIYGPRQVGKTTLAKEIISELGLKTLSINADEGKYLDLLSSRDLDKMKSLVSGYQLIFIDEAQRISNIGINLKILVDGLPDLKILVTGSSSFELANKISEPLTGRTWTFNLFPLSFLELKNLYNDFELNNLLEGALIFGGYPEVFTIPNLTGKKELLEELSRAYLYKDILELANIKHAEKIKDLLKLIAFQIGSEVSLTELSNNLDLSYDAVERYLDLLEKSFVLFRLGGFSRNLRKEVSKMDKIYFYDLGIRNTVIDNFKPLKDRNDSGQLWENFLIAERRKKCAYQNLFTNDYFWRTHTGAEIDYVEERDGRLSGYELKYGKRKARKPATWLRQYQNAEFTVINQDNYLGFIT